MKLRNAVGVRLFDQHDPPPPPRPLLKGLGFSFAIAAILPYHDVSAGSPLPLTSSACLARVIATYSKFISSRCAYASSAAKYGARRTPRPRLSVNRGKC